MVVVVVVVEVMVVEGRKEGVGANAFVVTRREREMKVRYIVWDFFDKYVLTNLSCYSNKYCGQRLCSLSDISLDICERLTVCVYDIYFYQLRTYERL